MIVSNLNFQQTSTCCFLGNPLLKDLSSKVLTIEQIQNFTFEQLQKSINKIVLNGPSGYPSNSTLSNQILLIQNLSERFQTALKQKDQGLILSFSEMILQIKKKYFDHQYSNGLIVTITKQLQGHNILELLNHFKQNEQLLINILLLQLQDEGINSPKIDIQGIEDFDFELFYEKEPSQELFFAPTNDKSQRYNQALILILIQFINKQKGRDKNLLKYNLIAKNSFHYSQILSTIRPLLEKDYKEFSLISAYQPIIEKFFIPENAPQEQAEEDNIEAFSPPGSFVELPDEVSDLSDDEERQKPQMENEEEQKREVIKEIRIFPDSVETINEVQGLMNNLSRIETVMLYLEGLIYEAKTYADQSEEEKQYDDLARKFLELICKTLKAYLEYKFKWFQKKSLINYENLKDFAGRKNPQHSPLTLVIMNKLLSMLSKFNFKVYSPIIEDYISSVMKFQHRNQEHILTKAFISEFYTSVSMLLKQQTKVSIKCLDAIKLFLKSQLFSKQYYLKLVTSNKFENFTNSDLKLLKQFEFLYSSFHTYNPMTKKQKSEVYTAEIQTNYSKFFQRISKKLKILPFSILDPFLFLKSQKEQILTIMETEKTEFNKKKQKDLEEQLEAIKVLNLPEEESKEQIKQVTEANTKLTFEFNFKTNPQVCNLIQALKIYNLQQIPITYGDKLNKEGEELLEKYLVQEPTRQIQESNQQLQEIVEDKDNKHPLKGIFMAIISNFVNGSFKQLLKDLDEKQQDQSKELKNILESTPKFMNLQISLKDLESQKPETNYILTGQQLFQDTYSHLENLNQILPVISQNFPIFYEISKCQDFQERDIVVQKYQNQISAFQKEFDIYQKALQFLTFQTFTLTYKKLIQPQEHSQILELIKSLVNLYKITIKNFIAILEQCFSKNQQLFETFKIGSNLSMQVSNWELFSFLQHLLGRIYSQLIPLYQNSYHVHTNIIEIPDKELGILDLFKTESEMQGSIEIQQLRVQQEQVAQQQIQQSQTLQSQEPDFSAMNEQQQMDYLLQQEEKRLLLEEERMIQMVMKKSGDDFKKQQEQKLDIIKDFAAEEEEKQRNLIKFRQKTQKELEWEEKELIFEEFFDSEVLLRNYFYHQLTTKIDYKNLTSQELSKFVYFFFSYLSNTNQFLKKDPIKFKFTEDTYPKTFFFANKEDPISISENSINDAFFNNIIQAFSQLVEQKEDSITKNLKEIYKNGNIDLIAKFLTKLQKEASSNIDLQSSIRSQVYEFYKQFESILFQCEPEADKKNLKAIVSFFNLTFDNNFESATLELDTKFIFERIQKYGTEDSFQSFFKNLTASCIKNCAQKKKRWLASFIYSFCSNILFSQIQNQENTDRILQQYRNEHIQTNQDNQQLLEKFQFSKSDQINNIQFLYFLLEQFNKFLELDLSDEPKPQSEEDQKKDKKLPSTSKIVQNFQGYLDFNSYMIGVLRYSGEQLKIWISAQNDLEKAIFPKEKSEKTETCFQYYNQIYKDLFNIVNKPQFKDYSLLYQVCFENLQCYTNSFDQKLRQYKESNDSNLNRQSNETEFLIYSILFIAKSLFEQENSLELTNQILNFMNFCINQVGKSKNIIFTQIFFILINKIITYNCDFSIISRNVEFYQKLKRKIAGKEDQEKVLVKLIKFQEKIYPETTKNVQQLLDQQFQNQNQQQTDYVQTNFEIKELQNNSELYKILKFLIENHVSQTSIEVYKEKNQFSSLLDGFVLGEIIKLVLVQHPKLFLPIINIKIDPSLCKLTNLSQENSFLTVLYHQEAFSQNKLIKLLTQVPFYISLSESGELKTSNQILTDYSLNFWQLQNLKHINEKILDDQSLYKILNFQKNIKEIDSENALKQITLYKEKIFEHFNEFSSLLTSKIQYLEKFLEGFFIQQTADFKKSNLLNEQFLSSDDYLETLFQYLKLFKKHIIFSYGEKKHPFVKKEKQYIYFYYQQNFRNYLESTSLKQFSNSSNSIISKLEERLAKIESLNKNDPEIPLQQISKPISEKIKLKNQLEIIENIDKQATSITKDSLTIKLLPEETLKNFDHKIKTSVHNRQETLATFMTYLNELFEIPVEDQKIVVVQEKEEQKKPEIQIEQQVQLVEPTEQNSSNLEYLEFGMTEKEYKEQKAAIKRIEADNLKKQQEKEKLEKLEQEEKKRSEELKAKAAEILAESNLDPEQQKIKDTLLNNNLKKKELTPSQVLKLEVFQIIKDSLQNIVSQMQGKIDLQIKSWQTTSISLTTAELNLIKKNIKAMSDEDRNDVIHRINDSILQQLEVPEWIEKQNKWKDTMFPVFKHDETLLRPEKSVSSGYDKVEIDLEFLNESEEQKFIFHDSPLIAEFKETIDPQFFLKMPKFSDQSIQSLILQIFQNNKAQLCRILKHLSVNFYNCYQIVDALTFILQLNKSDFQLLKSSDHILQNIFFNPINIKDTDPERLKLIIKNFFFENKCYFNLILGKYGHKILTNGMFNKCEQMLLLNDNFTLDMVNQGKVQCQPLEMITSARKILAAHYKDTLQDQHSFLQILAVCYSVGAEDHKSSVVSEVIKNLQTYSRIVVDLKTEKDKTLAKNELKKIVKIENLSNIYDLASVVDSPQEITKYYQADQVFCTDKPMWPYYDIFQIFESFPQFYEGFIAIQLQTKNEHLKKTYETLLNMFPKFLERSINALLETGAQRCNLYMKDLNERSLEFKKKFFEINKTVSSSASLFSTNKDLYKKTAEAFKTEIYTKSDNKLFEEQSHILFKGVQEFLATFNKLNKKIMKLINYKQKFAVQIQKLKKQYPSQEDEKTLAKQIAQVNLQKHSTKKLLMSQAINKVKDYLTKNREFNILMKQSTHYVLYIYQFIGYDDEEAQTTFKYLQTHFKYIIMSLIEISQTLGFLENQVPVDEDPTDELDQLESIQLGRLQSYYDQEGNQQAQQLAIQLPTLSKRQSSYLQRSYSKMHASDIQLDEIYKLIYGETFQFYFSQNCFQDEASFNKFKLNAMLRIKEKGIIPITEKLKFIKTIAYKRATEGGKYNATSDHYQIYRSEVWKSSLRSIFEKFVPQQLTLCDIRVKLDDDPATDAGGPRKEWLKLVSLDVFHPEYGLFKLSSNKRTLQPSPFAFLVPNYEYEFRMIGRFIAKILIENWMFEVDFSRSFLKHMLGKDLYISDLEDIDETALKALNDILNDGKFEEEVLCLPFVQEIKGNQKKPLYINLIENGNDILVNQTNKKQYCKAIAKALMIDNVEKSVKAFKKGMYDIIPQDALALLSDVEVGLHLAGLQKINVDDFKFYAEISGYAEDSPTMIAFWEVFREWSDQYRSFFLFFYSGSFKVPYEGFKKYRCKISKISDPKRMPLAHTCSNNIELPDYQDKALLKKQLELAVIDGFGGGFQIN